MPFGCTRKSARQVTAICLYAGTLMCAHHRSGSSTPRVDTCTARGKPVRASPVRPPIRALPGLPTASTVPIVATSATSTPTEVIPITVQTPAPTPADMQTLPSNSTELAPGCSTMDCAQLTSLLKWNDRQKDDRGGYRTLQAHRTGEMILGWIFRRTGTFLL